MRTRVRTWAVVVLLLGLGLWGCRGPSSATPSRSANQRGASEAPSSVAPASSRPRSTTSTAVPTDASLGPTEPFRLTSSAFANQDFIPAVYTCLGEDRIPPLTWTDPPPDTASFVLIMDDPDAPGGVWDHWVVYDIPSAVRAIPEGGPVPGVAGRNSWGLEGYGGPCPPPGPAHHYRFVLYAVDVPHLGLPAGATKDQVLQAIEGHILAQAQWVGLFQR